MTSSSCRSRRSSTSFFRTNRTTADDAHHGSGPQAGNGLLLRLAGAGGAVGLREIAGFTAGLRQDDAAVRAALTTPWGNGPVERRVNRLKTINRQMYGRAGFQLLRVRVLAAA